MFVRLVTTAVLLAFHANAADGHPERERECRQVKAQIERIHARRRMGYTAKAGRRMQQRLRELERRRSRVCR